MSKNRWLELELKHLEFLQIWAINKVHIWHKTISMTPYCAEHFLCTHLHTPQRWEHLDYPGFMKYTHCFKHKESKLPVLPTNFCGIELLRLATLFAILSSTKALSDAARFNSSLCSLWLFSSFTIKCKTEKPRIRFKYTHLSFWGDIICTDILTL